jgi:hypothetical protein
MKIGVSIPGFRPCSSVGLAGGRGTKIALRPSMAKRSTYKWFGVLLFALVSCQPGGGVRSQSRITLHLRLPASLPKGGIRFQHFLQRVVSLELELTSKDGFSAHYAFPPDQWDGFSFPDLDFPQTPTDVLTVKFQVWDLNGDGLPRTYPALSGKKRVLASEMSTSGTLEVPLRLSLNVSAAEY